MGSRKFLPRKCPAECGEKSGAIVATSLKPRVPWEVTAFLPSSVGVSYMFICISMCEMYVCGSSTTSLKSHGEKIKIKNKDKVHININ